MKWPCRTVAAAFIMVGLASPSFAGQVKLEIRDGLVTLDAKDATLREILAEWARVGRTLVVNADRVPGGPMTVLLTGVPERQALETLLRSAAGFLAAPRAVPQASASIYDRIVLMPGTRPAVVSTSNSPLPAGQSPGWQRDRIMPQPAVAADDEDEQAPNVQMPSVGSPQPGMPPGPVPFNGAAMPYPNGTPYGNPYNPNQPVNPNVPVTGAPQRPAPTTPQSAPRPGLPTPVPGPIKGPGGSGVPEPPIGGSPQ